VAGESTGPILELGCGAGRILAALDAGARRSIGVDLDRAALALAATRAPAVEWICDDGRTWRRDGLAASLVILGGDLLSITVRPDDLEALLRTAALHCGPEGQVGIDATLMDPRLFASETDGRWRLDLERADEEFATVRRESRLLPDPEVGRTPCRWRSDTVRSGPMAGTP